MKPIDEGLRKLSTTPEEFGEIVPITPPDLPISPISPPPTRNHPIPKDSILHEAVLVNREISEAPDSFTVAPLLCLAARLLTPGCYWDFAGRKYPNLFNFVVGPPGIRKSTSFGLAEKLAESVLTSPEIHGGSASDSALFESFETEPHKLQIEDEGNTLLEFWNKQGCGKELSARYLKLYDGKPWHQTFKCQKDSDGGASRHIPLATLSFALGGTPNTSKFAGINNASGLRRRFGYYVATRPAKRLTWPKSLEGVDDLADSFRELEQLQGVFELNPEAKNLWGSKIQPHFYQEEDKLRDKADAATEAKQASLTESPSRVLKLAGIFEACRWAKTSDGDGLVVRAETLEIAFQHQLACLEAIDELETIGRRAAIQEQADQILAKILTDLRFKNDDLGSHHRDAKRTELTSAFANNSTRSGMTTHQLYHEIIPNLIERGLCKLIEKRGRLERYRFFDDNHSTGVAS